jgi:hypothetical protein
MMTDGAIQVLRGNREKAVGNNGVAIMSFDAADKLYLQMILKKTLLTSMWKYASAWAKGFRDHLPA